MTFTQLNSHRKFLFISAIGLLSVLSSLANNDNPKKSALNERQRSVVTYFGEVALGFEYGNTTAVTRKWVNDMKIYVAGNAPEESKTELKRIIGELNTLTGDGFQIKVVSRKEDSNLLIFFGSKSEYAGMYPKEANLLKGSSGLCTISWNSRNHIINGHIFINEKISSLEQRHVIREELTQALGFGKDSPRYMDSVFQSQFTTPTEYAEIDRQLISLLYHPTMQPGLDATEAEVVIAKILLSATH